MNTPTGWTWPTIKRDTILFTFGLCGIFHEAFIHTGPSRPEFIMLFAGMCGLPLALAKDERKPPSAPTSDASKVGAA